MMISKFMIQMNIKISDEIIKFISTEVNTSIRELVGAFNRIVSFSRIYGKTSFNVRGKSNIKGFVKCK